MTKDQELLQIVREKLELEMMRQHLREETEKLKREVERVKEKFPGLR